MTFPVYRLTAKFSVKDWFETRYSRELAEKCSCSQEYTARFENNLNIAVVNKYNKHMLFLFQTLANTLVKSGGACGGKIIDTKFELLHVTHIYYSL